MSYHFEIPRAITFDPSTGRISFLCDVVAVRRQNPGAGLLVIARGKLRLHMGLRFYHLVFQLAIRHSREG
jgi:hypothetical protein